MPSTSHASHATPPSSNPRGAYPRTAQHHGTTAVISDLQERLAAQEVVVEKQGALLLGHAQLIHEMREEMAAMKAQGLGMSHTRHLVQVSAAMVRETAASVTHLQGEAERLESNTTRLAEKLSCTAEMAPPQARSVSAAILPEEPEAEANDASFNDANEADPMLSNITHITQHPDTSLKAADLLRGMDAPVRQNNVVPLEEFELVEEEDDDLDLAPQYDAAISGYQATPVGVHFQRKSTASGGGSVSGEAGVGLYNRGMAQKRRREEEIASKKRAELQQEQAKMRNPEITVFAKRSKSSEARTISTRTDEWRERREQKRATLRSEMKRIEDSELRPAPELNANSLKIAQHTTKGGLMTQTVSGSGAAAGGPSPAPKTPEHKGGGGGGGASDSPPPLDELLERLRKRRYDFFLNLNLNLNLRNCSTVPFFSPPQSGPSTAHFGFTLCQFHQISPTPARKTVQEWVEKKV